MSVCENFCPSTPSSSVNPYHVVESHSDQNLQRADKRSSSYWNWGVAGKVTSIQLSNGERRKVLIARALLKNPRLLILDNPFAGLDERFRAKLGENLDNLMQGDMRVIVVGTESR